MRHLFFGGIHPADKKELSQQQMPIPVKAPEKVVISMSQHIGAPCTPMVSVGEQVKIGQKIGDGQGLCVPVHASVSGIVTKIEPFMHANGSMVMAVEIQNDHKNLKAPGIKPIRHPEKMTKEELEERIREAGIVGMGGAAFPSYVKLQSAEEADTLIANGCECEPYITSDDQLMRIYPEKVLGGLSLIQKVLGIKRTILALEENKKEAIRCLKQKMEEFPNIQLKLLPVRYPQGAEKQLIQAVTGRQVPPGALPKEVGCLVLNTGTLAAIYEAVYEGKPLTERILTVTGEAVENPKNLVVPIGTEVSWILEEAGGLKENCWKVIFGGPMMGVSQKDLTASTLKGTNAILCLSQEQNGENPHPTCIRCGKCLKVCPMNLQPLYLAKAVEANSLEDMKYYHLMDCIECGCCAYTCPGKLPLVAQFRKGKKTMREAKV